MNQGNTQTIASFTGTLLRREHKLGQKFVRLVFREDDKDVLCVSTNPRTVALQVGQTYHVQGEFKHRGQQAYIFDPKIDMLKKHWRPIRRVVFGAVLVGCLASLGSVAYMEQHNNAPAPAASAANVQPVKLKPKVAPVVSTPAPAAVAATPAPVTTTPVIVKPKTTIVKTAAKTVTPTVVTPLPVAPQQTAVPDTSPAPTSDNSPTQSTDQTGDQSGSSQTAPPSDSTSTGSGTPTSG